MISFPAMAWWDVGHKVVASIAYSRLKPEVKTQVDKLTQELKKEYPELTGFVDIAPWPDELRKQKIETFTHWHYIDNPISMDGTPIKGDIDSDNAVYILSNLKTVLKNPNARTIEKARFLAFLVHIVGDLHQPMHTVSYFSKAHPDGDQGGNLYLVINPIKPPEKVNMHALWDSGFFVFDPEAGTSIEEHVKMVTTSYPEKFFGDAVNDLASNNWVKEGIEIAKQNVYSTPENQLPNKDYVTKGKDISAQRLALAGYRLANLLNVLLVPVRK